MKNLYTKDTKNKRKKALICGHLLWLEPLTEVDELAPLALAVAPGGLSKALFEVLLLNLRF